MENETYKLEKAGGIAGKFDSWHVTTATPWRTIAGSLQLWYDSRTVLGPNVVFRGESTLVSVSAESPASIQHGIYRDPTELQSLTAGWQVGKQEGLVALLKEVLVKGESLRGSGCGA